MPHVTWTAFGESDLEAVVSYIAEVSNRRSTAKQLFDEIVEKCDLYASQPLLGQPYPDLGEGYRGFVHKRWIVIYQPRVDGLEVFAVLDTSRQFTEYFQRRMGIRE